MVREREYAGDQVVFLPENYLNSIDAAVEIHAEDIAAVAATFERGYLDPSPSWRMWCRFVLGVMLWIAPVTWMACH